jgi:hypothetical protein
MIVDAAGKAQPEHDWLVTVPRDRDVIVIVCVATQKYFEQLRPTFEKMIGSVQLWITYAQYLLLPPGVSRCSDPLLFRHRRSQRQAFQLCL